MEGFKNSLLVNVATTVVIMLILQPLGKLGLELMPEIARGVLSGYSDYVIQGVAEGPREMASGLMLTMFVGALFGLQASVLSLSQSTARLTVAAELPQQGGQPNSIAAALTNGSGKSSPTWTSHRVLRFAVAMVGWTSAAHILFYCFAVSSLNAAFQQRLAVLRPHVDDQTYFTLASDWAGMQSWDDFQALSAKVDTVAADNAVSFPRSFARSVVMY